MEALKKLSIILMAPPIILLCYDLIYNWFVKNLFELENVTYWWKKWSPNSLEPAKTFLAHMVSTHTADRIFNAPAPIVLFVPPLFFYVLYRIIFLLQGGKAGGYKSRH